MTRRGRVLCVPVFLATLTGVGAQVSNRSTAVLLVNAGEYFGTTYTAPPAVRSSYVFLVGESITVRVEIANSGDNAIALLTKAQRPTEAISVQSTASLDVRIRDRVVLEHVGSADEVIEWAGRFDVGPGESLRFDVDLLGQVAPGEYVVDFATTVTDGEGRPVLPQASRFEFEVRKSDGADAELATRDAARAFLSGDDVTAEQRIGSLLRANPQSYAAHSLRGLMADRAGDRPGALRHYQQALRVLETRADEQFLQWNNATVVTQALEGMKRTVRQRGGQSN